jgi:hypothetical protein
LNKGENKMIKAGIFLKDVITDLGCEKTIVEKQEKALLQSFQQSGINTPYVKFLQEKYGKQ